VADVGMTLRVEVTSRNPGGPAYASATSPATTPLVAATAPAETAGPTISGTARDGETLTTTAGSWSGSPTIHYAYQWELCDAEGESCSEISAANATTYTAGRGDVGHTLRAVVTATNVAGSASATTAPSGAVTEPESPHNIQPPIFPPFFEYYEGEP